MGWGGGEIRDSFGSVMRKETVRGRCGPSQNPRWHQTGGKRPVPELRVCPWHSALHPQAWHQPLHKDSRSCHWLCSGRFPFPHGSLGRGLAADVWQVSEGPAGLAWWKGPAFGATQRRSCSHLGINQSTQGMPCCSDDTGKRLL